MINSDDMLIREKARRICADQAKLMKLDDWHIFLTGDYDSLPWMKIALTAVIAGISIERQAYAN